MTEQFLIVGLGNPGSAYKKNRHNIGFMAVDAIAEKYGASPWTKKFRGEISEMRGACRVTRGAAETDNLHGLRITNHEPRIFLFKPQTFMNLSGESVAEACRFYKIPSENIIVFHDDLDLVPGKLKVKLGGGNGGHNGLRSLDAHIGEQYWRARIGIGHPGSKDDVTPYVLGNFLKDEWDVQEKMLGAIKESFPLLIENDTVGFMNKVALVLNPLAAKPKPVGNA